MVATLRRLARLIKKDIRLLANYERSHPHFFLYLAIDGFLSVVLILAGFHFVAPNSALWQKLTHTGAVGMTSTEFVNHVKQDGVEAYWLGPVSGYVYTINHQVAGIADVFYLPNRTDPSDKQAFLYEVKTYKNQRVWDAHTHTILASTNTQTIVVSKVLSIRINPSSMKGLIATYSNKPEIVAMAFPKAQSLQDMIQHTKTLKLIQ